MPCIVVHWWRTDINSSWKQELNILPPQTYAHAHTCMALWIGWEIYLSKLGEQVAYFVERIWAIGETGGKEEREKEGVQTNKPRGRERGRADGRMMNWINMCPQIGVLAVKTAWSSASTEKWRDMSVPILINMLHLEFKQALCTLIHSLTAALWVNLMEKHSCYISSPKLEEKKKNKVFHNKNEASFRTITMFWIVMLFLWHISTFSSKFILLWCTDNENQHV